MREVEITPELALGLGRLRAAVRRRYEGLCSGNWIREESPGRVRLQDVEAIERELGTTLPDPVVAYIAAGVSIWGDGPISILGIRERTLEVRERIEELTAGDDDAHDGARCVVIDDDSNGNYIGVMPGSPRDSDTVLFLDHEEAFDAVLTLGILDEINRKLEGADIAAEPFAMELYDEPDPEPEVIWVSHAKFGRGKVVAQIGDSVTVLFDEAGEKRLKRAFVSFD